MGEDEALAWNTYLNDPTEENRIYAESVSAAREAYMARNQEALEADTGNSWISKDLAGYLPQFLGQNIAGIKGGIGGGAVGTVVPVFGTATGLKAGYTAGRALYGYETARGRVFKALLDAGVPEDQARSAANDEAIVSSVIEGGDAVIDMITLGFGNLLKKGGTAAAKSTLPKILRNYGINVGSEGLQEWTQEGVSIANQNRNDTGILNLVQESAGQMGRAISGQDPEALEQMNQAGLTGLKIAAMMGGGGIAFNTALSKAASPLMLPTAGQENGYQKITEQDAINQFNQNVNNRPVFMPDNPLVNMLPTVEDEQNRFLPGSPLYKRAGRKNVATEMDGPSESLVSTDNMLRYRDTIDSVFTGALPTGSDIVLGKTPSILTEYGAPELDLHMKQSVARKIAYPSGYMGGKHNLGLSALKNLPYQLADPIAIIENPQSNSRGLASKIVLTEWTDMDGKPVIVPIHLNAQGAIDVQNEVASAFGADYIRRIIGDNGENILYTKNNEGIEQLLSKGRPVPQAMADDVLARNSIPNTLHDVNQQYGPESSIGNSSVGGGSVGAMRSNYNYQQNTSRVGKNTFSKMYQDVLQDIERNGGNVSGLTYDVVTERQSMDNAQHRLFTDLEGEINDLPNRKEWGGEDLDTAMGILDRYMAEAIESGIMAK